MNIPVLHTERLILRPHKPEDFEVFAEMSADPRVMQYIDEPLDRFMAFRSFCAMVGMWEVRGYGIWAVEEKATGRLVGRAGVLRWEESPGVEIGYSLSPAAWGKGYATEAAARSLQYAHETLGVREVSLVIRPENTGSQRVAEKLGARLDREEMIRKHLVRIYLHSA